MTPHHIAQVPSYEDVIFTFRIVLAMVNAWLRANKLTPYANKTKYVLFGTTAMGTMPLKIHNLELKRVTFFKYQGMVLDNRLLFGKHIDYAKLP